eukprot:ANDGO_06176.mRNA.1 Ultraviolet-B receptor UVR8
MLVATCADASELYSCGSDEFGVMGIGSKYAPGPTTVLWPSGISKLEFLKSTDGMRFKQVHACMRYSIALTVDGVVYTWGSAWFGTLGIQVPNITRSYSIPQKVAKYGVHAPEAGRSKQLFKKRDQDARENPASAPATPTIAFIAANDFHCAAISTDGDLYVWGSNKHGQLALPTDPCNGTVFTPHKVTWFSERGLRVRSVACGLNHTIAAASDGEVYVWGDNTHGYLGLGVDPPASASGIVATPTLIDVLHDRDITYLCAGAYHSCALSSEGDMYTWGAGENGQTGHNECRDLPYPKIVRGVAGRPVAFCAAGGFSTAAITTEGKMYTWGHNAFGKLGLANDGGEIVRLPTLCRTLASKSVRMVSLGAFGGAAVTKTGDLYTWGLSEHGALARDLPEERAFSAKPVKVTCLHGVRFAGVACGWIHTIALSLPQKSLFELEQNAHGVSHDTSDHEGHEDPEDPRKLKSHAFEIPPDRRRQLEELQAQMVLLQKQIREATIATQKPPGSDSLNLQSP